MCSEGGRARSHPPQPVGSQHLPMPRCPAVLRATKLLPGARSRGGGSAGPGPGAARPGGGPGMRRGGRNAPGPARPGPATIGSFQPGADLRLRECWNGHKGLFQPPAPPGPAPCPRPTGLRRPGPTAPSAPLRGNAWTTRSIPRRHDDGAAARLHDDGEHRDGATRSPGPPPPPRGALPGAAPSSLFLPGVGGQLRLPGIPGVALPVKPWRGSSKCHRERSAAAPPTAPGREGGGEEGRETLRRRHREGRRPPGVGRGCPGPFGRVPSRPRSAAPRPRPRSQPPPPS